MDRRAIVVLQLESPLATVIHAIRLARELGKTVVLNPAPAQSLSMKLLAQIDYLVPSEIEAAMLADVPTSGNDSDETIAVIIEKLCANGSSKVLVTFGEKGVYAALSASTAHFDLASRQDARHHRRRRRRSASTPDVPLIDLALTRDVPGFMDTLQTVLTEVQVERACRRTDRRQLAAVDTHHPPQPARQTNAAA